MMWRNLDESVSYHSHLEFLSYAVNQLGIRSMVEVGVLYGALSERILRESPLLKRYYMIDPWRKFTASPAPTQRTWDSRYRQVVALMEPFGKRAKILRMGSIEASSMFVPNSFDMVYLDANHSFEYVNNDIKAWWPKIHPDGYLAGHDLTGQPGKREWKGVREAVESNFGTQYHSGGRNWDGVWIVSKEEYGNQ